MQDTRSPPSVLAKYPLFFWSLRSLISGKNSRYFSLSMTWRDFVARSKTSMSVCDARMCRACGIRVHVHAGNRMLNRLDFEVPGATLTRRSCSFGSFRNTRSAMYCNSPHRYSMCQFHMGLPAPGICSQNS